MATPSGRPSIRVSKVSGRYLLFDIDDVMYLRRHHNICSPFTGTTPQNPQQNIFMGLPLELMPEEVQVLVDEKVAYVVDDAVFHPSRLASLDDSSRRAYIESLRSEGRKAALEVAEIAQRNQAMFREKHNKKKAKAAEQVPEDAAAKKGVKDDESGIFDSPLANVASPALKSTPSVEPYAVTPTTSSLLMNATPLGPTSDSSTPGIDVPASYPLYAHLHDRGYYMMPGLRFGCDYNVYPGDPLRFHSHFQATHYGWDEEISMIDLVGGGRLGTGVKKGYLIGGEVQPSGDGGSAAAAAAAAATDQEPGKIADDDENVGSDSAAKKGATAPPVRTFCIEWAAM
ncbi:tRNA intron endonuclease [Xylariomycetidae sp. FL2044]|nr:tRNA intron endonuclease [Xylariomycetidae sp. FL2044]